MEKKSFGSGYFGEWIEDEFGLPAYHYTCDQINDPKAITPMDKKWRLPTEHLHQVGNDRLVGVASNYGYIQVRQDEGSPKYLNEFNPEHGYYAGGFGYLTDGTSFLSTYYPGNANSFERVFGIGYIQKKVKGHGFTVNQIIFAPFGDDPVLISRIMITNNRTESVNLRWIEYWGVQMYQFSFRAYSVAVASKNIQKHPRDIRREFSEKFIHEFKVINENMGLQELKSFEGIKDSNNIKNTKPSFEDYHPPNTFLISLDSPVDTMSTNGDEFFGEGGVMHPDGLLNGFKMNLRSSGKESAMLFERKIHLTPGESQSIYFMYGYTPDGYEINDLIDKYRKNYTKILNRSCKCWGEKSIELAIQDEPWVHREIMWHNYYLRGAMTYDNFFKEHILSQGQIYQYIIGFQGAARDPLQHALPFIFIEPDIVKSIIRYTLKMVTPSGRIHCAITGNGQIFPIPLKPSDLELWLLWVTSEYILGTRDMEFLDEVISTYPLYQPDFEKVKVYDLLQRCYNHLVKKTGTGQHGLIRLSTGDWNDNVILGHISPERHKEIEKQAESVLNAAMAIHALKVYSEMLDFLGKTELAKNALNWSNSQRNSVRNQWTGKWFSRAWLTEDLGWIGEEQLWLEPQPWAIIGDVLNREQKKALLQSIDHLLRKSSKIGARILSRGLDKHRRNVGEGTNGGIWPAINGTLVWGLSLIEKNMAWDEWKKNSLAFHAENYPEIWYGIWSGPDTYNSELSKYPGHTFLNEKYTQDDLKIKETNKSIEPVITNWTDFPVFNLHTHAWPLFNTKHLMGINFTKDGVELNPIISNKQFNFSTPLIGLVKTKEGYSGWYDPKGEGTWKIVFKASKEELNNIESIFINGKKENFVRRENCLEWDGKSTMNNPLRWILKK
jgi:hypothetical protein